MKTLHSVAGFLASLYLFSCCGRFHSHVFSPAKDISHGSPARRPTPLSFARGHKRLSTSVCAEPTGFGLLLPAAQTCIRIPELPCPRVSSTRSDSVGGRCIRI